MTTTNELVTQAEHARRCGVSRKSVTIWKSRGLLKLDGDLVDFEASYKGERWHASAAKFHKTATTEPTPSQGAAERSSSVRKTSPPKLTKMTRGEVASRLRGLDWTGTFDWSETAMHDRTVRAAAVAGLEAVQSPLDDDGHWGGYQLRNLAVQAVHGGLCFEAVAAGFGFELDTFQALAECREHLHYPDDTADDLAEVIEVRLDLLPLLAYPFGPAHQRPTATEGAAR